MKFDWNSLHSVIVRNLCWKWNFRANFGVLSLGFDVKALIPQGLTAWPNYFGVLNNLMTWIICESLREIGEMACVTSAWSSRGQTLNTVSLRSSWHACFCFSAEMSQMTPYQNFNLVNWTYHANLHTLNTPRGVCSAIGTISMPSGVWKTRVANSE